MSQKAPQEAGKKTACVQATLHKGGGFYEKLVSAYRHADSSNKAALDHAFPNLEALVFSHCWVEDGDDLAPRVCAQCGREENRWAPDLCK